MADSPRSLRKRAHELHRHALRVYHYRRDELEEKNLTKLVEGIAQLKTFASRRNPATPSETSSFLDHFEPFLRTLGARFFPRSGWVENIEMLLVAAIVALGIRTYIIQPFQIPTNSMYPSYYGMTHQIYETGESPGFLTRGLLTLDRAASFFSVSADSSGEILLPIQFDSFGRPNLRFEPARGRRLIVLPAPAKSITFRVGDSLATVTVPADFDLREVLQESGILPNQPTTPFVEIRGETWMRSGVQAQAQVPFLEFAIFAGDALFVDRFSYHFVRPSIGDPIVFRTGQIEALQHEGDKYYIKRMVGEGGDTLEVVPPFLMRNGIPISGNQAFVANQDQIPPFRGYTALGLLSQGREYFVPPNQVFAMGDNSPNSSDSRNFGSFPRDQVIGRALFRYYPFSRVGTTD